MATGQIKTEEEKKVVDGYNPIGEEKKVKEEFERRKEELFESRNNIQGLDIDEQMRDWDKKYFATEADIPASEMDSDRKPLPLNTAYGKIQTALSILIDRNPDFTLEEDAPMYSANRELIKQLARKSFRDTNSLGQFKLSVHNMAKRGWFVGRTFNRRIDTTNKMLKEIDKSGKEIYEEYKTTHMDDVAYMNLSNYNAWLDEETKPEDFYSTRDWMWREVWHIDDLRDAFPEKLFPNMKHVTEGGDTGETPDLNNTSSSYSSTDNNQEQKEGLVEIYFYENYKKDWFIIEANGIMIVWEPLPQDHKRLSCVYGYWHLRSDDNIYGIGVVEEMDKDEEFAVRVANMTLRQLLLTIAPAGFYTGSEDPEEENIKITPGVLRRVMDPKNITWLEIPEGNGKGLEVIQWLKNQQDEKTGITAAVEGNTGNNQSDTAFELGISREAGMKRLRLPLRTLQNALDWEFQNRIALIQQVYSDFDVEVITDETTIMDYMDEVNADPEFYYIENEGQAGKEVFYRKNFREFKLGLEQNDKGEYVEADDERFFKVSPKSLSFRGRVRVKIDSLLVNSEELEKADTLRMSNIILPIIAQGQPEIQGPAVKQILEAFNKDPKKWLPPQWLEAMGIVKKPEEGGQSPEAQVPENVQNMLNNNRPPAEPGADTVVPANEVASAPSLSSRLGAAYRGFKDPNAV